MGGSSGGMEYLVGQWICEGAAGGQKCHSCAPEWKIPPEVALAQRVSWWDWLEAVTAPEIGDANVENENIGSHKSA